MSDNFFNQYAAAASGWMHGLSFAEVQESLALAPPSRLPILREKDFSQLVTRAMFAGVAYESGLREALLFSRLALQVAQGLPKSQSVISNLKDLLENINDGLDYAQHFNPPCPNLLISRAQDIVNAVEETLQDENDIVQVKLVPDLKEYSRPFLCVPK